MGAPQEESDAPVTDAEAVDGLYTEVDGEGPSVVLTHDGLSGSASFDAQFAALVGAYRGIR